MHFFSGNHSKLWGCILYNPSYDVVSCSRDQDGRHLCVEFSKDGNLIQLVNVYAPNSAKPASVFFESLYQVLYPDFPTVLCGAFNTVVDPIKDRFGCNYQSRSAYNWSATLHHLMSTYDLHNAWRKIYPNSQELLSSAEAFLAFLAGQVIK
jgi:exonuclease III